MSHISVYCRNSLLKEYSFIDDSIISIGRSASNDVILPDPAKRVSRHHAVLVKADDGMGTRFIRDLGSRYPVRLHGEFTARGLLRDGDAFEIAEYRLVIRGEKLEARPDHLRIVPKRIVPSALDDSTLHLSTLANLVERRLDDSQREFIAQLGKVNRLSPDAHSYAALVMPALCRVVGADRGFIRLFRHTGTLPHVDLGIVGLQPQDAIEVSDGQFMEQINGGSAVVEADAVLSPIARGGSVLGMICVDRHPGSEPFSSDEIDFLSVVGPMLEKQFQTAKPALFPEPGAGSFRWPKGLIGKGKVMKKLTKQISEAAMSSSAVLILGETGTGKELVARGIHSSSGRSGKFLAQNVAQVTESLAESAIFGYVPKAGIAGADAAGAAGWFELADRGTLFLDEIQRLTPALQDKFLRVLQEKEVSRIGARSPKAVDVKVLAATDSDLERALKDGTLRGAFYFRFERIIHVPALRDRKEDIPRRHIIFWTISMLLRAREFVPFPTERWNACWATNGLATSVS